MLEDIFEAEDSIDPSSGSHEGAFFSKLTDDWTKARLSIATIAKLEKLISKLSRARKRTRSGPTPLPVGSGGTADLDHNILSRLLKLLERSVKAGEDLNPFGQSQVMPQAKQTSKATAEGQSSPINAVAPEEPVAAGGVSAEDVDKMDSQLDVLNEALLASECCIALLTSDHLQKQVGSKSS